MRVFRQNYATGVPRWFLAWGVVLCDGGVVEGSARSALNPYRTNNLEHSLV
jgi:hypothetical protein